MNAVDPVARINHADQSLIKSLTRRMKKYMNTIRCAHFYFCLSLAIINLCSGLVSNRSHVLTNADVFSIRYPHRETMKFNHIANVNYCVRSSHRWVKALDSEQLGVVWSNGVFFFYHIHITYKTIIGYTSYSLFWIQYLHMMHHTHISLRYKWWPRSCGSLSWGSPLFFTLYMVTGFNPFRPIPNGRHLQIHLRVWKSLCFD